MLDFDISDPGKLFVIVQPYMFFDFGSVIAERPPFIEHFLAATTKRNIKPLLVGTAVFYSPIKQGYEIYLS